MARIGILGGTFDPIHNGHLVLGKQAYEEFNLDRVWFMPNGSPPHKQERRITEGNVRRDMVKLAVAHIPFFLCSDFELQRKGKTYTAQTLTLLHREYPEDTFYFIIGADSLYEIEHWYHPELVMELAVLLVAGRAYRRRHRNLEEQIAFLTQSYGARIHPIHCPNMDISSKGIRDAVANGRSIRDAVPGAVETYIKSSGLYTKSGQESN